MDKLLDRLRKDAARYLQRRQPMIHLPAPDPTCREQEYHDFVASMQVRERYLAQSRATVQGQRAEPPSYDAALADRRAREAAREATEEPPKGGVAATIGIWKRVRNGELSLRFWRRRPQP